MKLGYQDQRVKREKEEEIQHTNLCLDLKETEVTEEIQDLWDYKVMRS